MTERTAEGHHAAARNMLTATLDIYRQERERENDPTARWATVSVKLSEAIGIGNEDTTAWLLIGGLVEAAARLVDADDRRP